MGAGKELRMAEGQSQKITQTSLDQTHFMNQEIWIPMKEGPLGVDNFVTEQTNFGVSPSESWSAIAVCQ